MYLLTFIVWGKTSFFIIWSKFVFTNFLTESDCPKKTPQDNGYRFKVAPPEESNWEGALQIWFFHFLVILKFKTNLISVSYNFFYYFNAWFFHWDSKPARSVPCAYGWNVIPSISFNLMFWCILRLVYMMMILLLILLLLLRSTTHSLGR